jgi:hypothetical protein
VREIFPVLKPGGVAKVRAYHQPDRRHALAAAVRVTTHGDLLDSGAGERHGGRLLDVARKLWPRWFFRFCIPHNGLFMLIQATKPR